MGKSRIDLSDVYAIQNRYSDEWDERTVTNRGGVSYTQGDLWSAENYDWDLIKAIRIIGLKLC